MTPDPTADVPPNGVHRLGPDPRPGAGTAAGAPAEPVDAHLGPLADEDIDRLFRGETPPGDPALGSLAPFVGALRGASFFAGDAWLRENVAAAAAAARETNVVSLPTSGRGRRIRVGVAAAAATVVLTAGLAAADTLPRPVQAFASRAVAVIGVSLPDGRTGEHDSDRGQGGNGDAPGPTVAGDQPGDPGDQQRGGERHDDVPGPVVPTSVGSAPAGAGPADEDQGRPTTTTGGAPGEGSGEGRQDDPSADGTGDRSRDSGPAQEQGSSSEGRDGSGQDGGGLPRSTTSTTATPPPGHPPDGDQHVGSKDQGGGGTSQGGSESGHDGAGGTPAKPDAGSPDKQAGDSSGSGGKHS